MQLIHSAELIKKNLRIVLLRTDQPTCFSSVPSLYFKERTYRTKFRIYTLKNKYKQLKVLPFDRNEKETITEIYNLPVCRARVMYFHQAHSHTKPNVRWPTTVTSKPNAHSKFKSLTTFSNHSQQITIHSQQIQIIHSKFKSPTANSNHPQQITNQSHQIQKSSQQIQYDPPR